MVSGTVNIVVTEFIVIALACFLLIRYYKSNIVTWDVTLAVYISWVLGFAGILLLPYDVADALVNEKVNSPLVDVWRFTYWSTFVLAWFLLPIQLEYHNSGEFHFVNKMKDAIFKNIQLGALAATAVIIYIIYMVSTSHGSPSQVIGFLMAMSNTYGVVFIIVLLGNGLVALPKRLWEMADYERELVRLYVSASGIENSFQEARYELEDCELEVKKAENIIEIAVMGGTFERELLNFVSILNNRVANFEFANRATTRQYTKNSDTLEDREKYRSRKNFIELNSRLIRAQIQARACEIRWVNLLKDINKLETFIATVNSPGENFGWCEMPLSSSNSGSKPSSPKSSNSVIQRISTFRQYLCYIWTYRLHKICCRVLSILCCLASSVILFSETMLATNWISPVGIIVANSYNSSSIQLLALLVLSYMSICTYWSLFRINLGFIYSLQGPNQSIHSSLIFNGEYFSRLQFTLGYNFLLVLRLSKTEYTAFSKLMSNLELIPVFGSSFLTYVPLIMIIVSLLTLFNGFTKICRFFGIDTLETSSSNIFSCKKIELEGDDLQQYNSGKTIIANEMKRQGHLHDVESPMSSARDRETKTAKNSGRYGIELSKTPPRVQNSAIEAIEESKKSGLFSSNSKVKYSKQPVLENDDDDDDVDSITFSFNPADSSSSSSHGAPQSKDTGLFTSWKLFNQSENPYHKTSSVSPKVAYNGAAGHTAPAIQTASSKVMYSDPYSDKTSSFSKLSTASISFRTDDEDDDDESGGRYSGI